MCGCASLSGHTTVFANSTKSAYFTPTAHTAMSSSCALCAECGITG